MNKVGRILLLVGCLVLALLVGLLIGRGQRAQPTSEAQPASVQITTTAPPSAKPPPPLPASLPPPPPAPKPVAIPKLAPELQVQEDAAAVGMTTREPSEAEPAPPASAPQSAAATGDEALPPPPNG
jgi:hypothetical protein